MMRALHALCALAACLSLATATARAEGDPWADLARRIAGGDPFAQLSVAIGAEPPGFVFPLPVRPALPVLGSTWFASKKNAPPLVAHVYYAATSHTGTASEALFAELAEAGYTRLPDPEGSIGFGRSAYGARRSMCPRDLRRPAIDVTIADFDGLPALEIEVEAHAESTRCREAAIATDLASHDPMLTDIPGLTFRGRMITAGPVQRVPYSTATVRTALPAGDAVAKIAERFVAKGWTALPAALANDTITQRFVRVTATRRWEALLVCERRAEGVYDVLIDLRDSATGS